MAKQAKTKIHWWDSPGKYTCHKNEPKLSFAESYLGEVFLSVRDHLWHVRTPNAVIEEGFSNVRKAQAKLLELLDAEPIGFWD